MIVDKNLEITEELEVQIKQYMPNNAILADISGFFALFSDPTRVKILSVLSISELCVTDVAFVLDLNQTTVSHQLKLLKNARLVKSRRNGKIIYYKATGDVMNDVMMLGAKCLGY